MNTVRVIYGEDPNLTEEDKDMDLRAQAAVKAAVERARVCKKPLAGFDIEKRKAYIEYPNGERKYAE